MLPLCKVEIIQNEDGTGKIVIDDHVIQGVNEITLNWSASGTPEISLKAYCEIRSCRLQKCEKKFREFTG